MASLTWFIGDIHGCLEALQRLEALVERTSAREGADPEFVSLGDLVDRGPDSAGVIRHFRLGAAAGTHRAILGNHEEMMLRTLVDHAPDTFVDLPFSPYVSTGDLYRFSRPAAAWLSQYDFLQLTRLMWLSQGGASTLASFGVDPSSPLTWWLPEDDLAYLCSLPLILETDDVVCTHALATTGDLDALRAGGELNPARRDLYQRVLWTRRLPDVPPDTEKIHVSGHTPLRRVRRYPTRKLVRVDTGCCYGMRLSAWCPQLDRSVSVSAYP